MKLIKRIIILVIAAWLGSVVYVRFKAVENVVTKMEKPPLEKSDSRSAPSDRLPTDNRYSRQNDFKGGIGPVGNPYGSRPKQRNHY